jgi:hypothetical protein
VKGINKSLFVQKALKPLFAMPGWIWVVVFLLPVLSGCYSTSLLIGVREPDLTKIQRGETRDQVEKVLGKRAWCAGTADGLTYNIYQYKPKRPPKPILGLVGYGLDYCSVGIIEYNILDVRTFASKKEVAVAYDATNHVRFVSPAWRIDMGGPGSRMRCLLPDDAGIPATVRPTPLANATNAGSTAATLRFPLFPGLFYPPTTVDYRPIEGHVVKLPPGCHRIEYKTVIISVELDAGRVYQLKDERYYPGYSQGVTILWIEDEESNETIFCSFPSSLITDQNEVAR